MTPAFQAGLHLYNLDRNDDAAREFRRHLVDEPNDATGHAYLALCLVERDEVDEATHEAKRAIELDPTDDFGYYVLGRTFIQRNRMPEARQALQEAIQIAPESPHYHGFLGIVEMKEQRWPAALAAADRGLACDPENSLCLNLRSSALTQMGRRAEAAQTIEQALAKDPDNDWSHSNQGWAELHNGNPHKAMEHFREALRLNPESNQARAGIAEAMKARNVVYRLMLGFFLWMSRLSSQMRWVVIIAIFVAPTVLRNIAKQAPDYAWLAEGARQLLFVFVAMTWIANPLFNLVLRFDKFGKHALMRDDLRGANLLAIFLFPALILWVTSWFTPEPYKDAFFLSAWAIGVLVLPASALFNCDPGWPRKSMLAYLIVLGTMAAAVLVTVGIELHLNLYYPDGGPAERPVLLLLLALPGALVMLPVLISPIVTFFLAQWLVKAEVKR